MEAALEQLNRVIEDVKQSNRKFLDQQAETLMNEFRRVGNVLPSDAKDSCAAELISNVLGKVEKHQNDTLDDEYPQIQSKFVDAFKRTTGFHPSDIDRASLAGLTDAQCRQALPLACKIVQSGVKLFFLEMNLTHAFDAHVQQLDEQFEKLDEDATESSNTASAKAEDLEEKLRCSICMDRPKDTAFACGHLCCGQCASEWKQCYYNCKSERRQKPAKHSFPIFL